jgi:hypothetical protein
MVIGATAGQRHAARLRRPLLEAGAVKRPGRGRPQVRPAVVAADKGDSVAGLRCCLRRPPIRAVIPARSDQPCRHRFDTACRRRRQVGRMIDRRKGWRLGRRSAG